MIKLIKLTKKFLNHKALNNITLDIDLNNIVAIIGPSGSGKTTLLRCINMLEVPSSGEIYLNNNKITKNNIHDIGKKVAMVFQNFNLFPHFTVLENLTYGPIKVNKLTVKAAEEKAFELLEIVGLKSKANMKPSEISGGQKQRVAIARALMMDPEVILFDEPTSALDLEIIKDFIDLLESLKTRNITMLIVTHHIGFAKSVADKIIFMEQGYVLDYMDTQQFFIEPSSYRAKLFLEKIKGI